jgi:Peptidase family S41
MLRRWFTLLFVGAVCFSASRAEPAFDPKPWLADLEQMRVAFASRYANLEWAATDRGAVLDEYFERARKRIAAANDAGSARAAFDGLIRRLGDGHVEIDWPAAAPPAASNGPAAAPDPCGDYDERMAGTPLLAKAASYQPLVTAWSASFPAGIIRVGARRVGVLRIGMFGPQGTPPLCRAALAALAIPADKPCDDACAARIDTWTAARFSEDFMLKAQHIDALLIDVTDNGGGSEWAEAAVRIVTPIRLTSERVDFVRGPQWVKELGDSETDLRKAAETASPADRAFLLTLADQAKAKRAVAATPCDGTPLLKGARPNCAWLGEGFYGSGLVASADPARLKGRPWAATVFSPMEYPWREGVWRGPLLVLVDGETWSAAEEFAAVLQDNRAARILGEPTGGAGCGHTDGSEPVVLANSGGRLELPDCARLRRDGSNEVRGIVPDLALPWHRHDGADRRAADVIAILPAALAGSVIRHRPR